MSGHHSHATMGTSRKPERFRQGAKYGIDAPRVVRVYIISAALLAFPTLINLVGLLSTPIPAPWCIGTGLLAALLFAWAVVMLWSSLAGKIRVRDRLINALNLVGDEQVLDAGCGRGLALIGCAKKLTTGYAVGIDIWAEHLSDNNPEATQANAMAEGVADLIEIETGDITRLPYWNEEFDAVISMTVIHNIPSQKARDQALHEIIRVLKPGGRIAIFDLLHTARYAEILRQAGLTVESLGWDLLWLMPCRSLLARKPEAGTELLAGTK